MDPDTGRQYERTELAWVRTALLVLGISALVAREPPSGAWGPFVVGAVAVAVVLVATVVTRRARSLSRHVAPAQAPAWETGLMVMAVLLLQLAGLAVSL